MAVSRNKSYRNILGLLLVIIALNAFGGGWYGIAGAEGVPLTWLEGTPFKNYLYPSLFLMVIIGGMALFSAVTLFSGKPYGAKAALYTAIVLMLWIIVQIIMIGFVSWLQPVTFFLALLIIVFYRLVKTT